MPILGTRKLHRLEENLASVEVALTPADLDELTTAAASIEIKGGAAPVTSNICRRLCLPHRGAFAWTSFPRFVFIGNSDRVSAASYKRQIRFCGSFLVCFFCWSKSSWPICTPH